MGIQSKSTSEQPAVADSSAATPNSVPQFMPHPSVSSLVSDQPPPLNTPTEPLPETYSTFHIPAIHPHPYRSACGIGIASQ